MAEEKKKKPTKHDLIQAELDEIKSLLQRTQADFVNYRRRNEEDRAKFAQMACSDILEQILPVMDNFALAAKHVPVELEGNNWVVGVQAVEKQLEQILMANGLERLEVVGKTFDPNTMEAIKEEKEENKENHIVLNEVAAGYMLNGKLLRPAKVIVNIK
jgi:molecular chaperone GrpE